MIKQKKEKMAQKMSTKRKTHARALCANTKQSEDSFSSKSFLNNTNNADSFSSFKTNIFVVVSMRTFN